MGMHHTNKKINFENETFDHLIRECDCLEAGAQLSHTLRNRLQKFKTDRRKEIVTRAKGGCAPLFIACKRGHVQIVQYLITECHADIEQRGLYEVVDDHSVHNVTPLWCAAVCGNYSVLQCLVNHGADVNAVSGSGSTPVRSACYMTYIDVVMYLVEKGADIHKPNHNGGTCLINSVQSVELCTFLIEHGADVNASDIRNKTALHYAIQERSLETTKLLLKHNADPYLKAQCNDDALQTACLKGAVQIFEYLVENVEYSHERLADAYELMGSTFFDEHNNTQKALEYWRAGLAIRNANAINGVPIPKRPVLPKRDTYKYASEFTTLDELDAIALDLDSMRIQSLLICERVLGAHHKYTLARLTLRGASYVDVIRYQNCIDLWLHALEIRVEKDSILHVDTFFHAQTLLALMVQLNEKPSEIGDQIRDKEEPRFCDVVTIFKLLSDQLIQTRGYLKERPVHNTQCENYERILKCVIHLISLLIERGTTEEEKALTRELVTNLVKENPTSVYTGDTLLHFGVSKINTISFYYAIVAETFYSVTPVRQLVQLLLECGAPVNARNDARSTPLYVASRAINFHNCVIQLLLDYGAHIDTPNLAGETPIELISKNPLNIINTLNYTTLKCHAAQAIRKHDINCTELPATLHQFLKYHGK